MKSKEIEKQCKKNCEVNNPILTDISDENNRGRHEIRKVEVYDKLDNINKNDWIWIKTIIKVERKVKEKWKIEKETAYYISSLWHKEMSARDFNLWIRGHWKIENSLHWVKDVTFKEDASKIISDNAPHNMSLIRNIAINIFRQNGYTNMAQAIRLLANDIYWLLLLF